MSDAAAAHGYSAIMITALPRDVPAGAAGDNIVRRHLTGATSFRARGGVLRLVACLSSALLLTGCAGQPSAGTMDFGGDPGQVCTSTTRGEDILLGEVLTPLTEDITIESVSLVEASGVTIDGAYVLPIAGDAIGTSMFPPSASTSWADKEPAEGAALSAHVPVNLVLHVTRDSQASASFKSIAIEYNQRGSGHNDHGSTSYSLQDSC